MVCDLWYLEDWEEKADWLTYWMNQLMTNVFVEQPRLAATPGLLNILGTPNFSKKAQIDMIFKYIQIFSKVSN